MSTKLLAGLALAAQTRAAVVEANAHDISLLQPVSKDLDPECLRQIGANPGFFNSGETRPDNVEFLLPNNMTYIEWSKDLDDNLFVKKDARTPFTGLDGMKVVEYQTVGNFQLSHDRSALDTGCNTDACRAVKLSHPDNALSAQCVQDLASLLASKAKFRDGDKALLEGVLQGFGKAIAAKASDENADQTLSEVVNEIANHVGTDTRTLAEVVNEIDNHAGTSTRADQTLSKIGKNIADKANFVDKAFDTLVNMYRDIAADVTFDVNY